MDDMIIEQFKGHLFENEEILWTGQPDIKVLFSGSDIFLIPFSILWGGFALLWEALVVMSTFGGMGDTSDVGMPIIIFPLVGALFVLVGLYFMFGRFIYKTKRKKKTFYAVTSRRILILTKARNENLQSMYINSIPSINKSIKANGTGTIRFGSSFFGASMYGNTGLDFFGNFYNKDIPTFYDLRDANNVYDLVNKLIMQDSKDRKGVYFS